MTLLLLQYNNYFNRVIKVDTYEGYITHTHKLVPGVAFNPNDGVETEQIINWTESFNPDYCVVINENSEIVSRWFIKEAVRTRNGQYRLSLRRDLLADYNSEVLNAPCFIEKATLNDNDPGIFNSEQMSYNEIKTSETQLKDRTGVSWIVGYLSRENTFDSNIEVRYQAHVDEELNGIQNYEYYEYIANDFYGPINDVVIAVGIEGYDYRTTSFEFKNYYACFNRNGPQNINFAKQYFNIANSAVNVSSGYLMDSHAVSKIIGKFDFNTRMLPLESLTGTFSESDWDELEEELSVWKETKTISELNDLINENGKIIKDTSTNKFYRVRISESDGESSIVNPNEDISNIMYNIWGKLNTQTRGGFTPYSQTRISTGTLINLKGKVYKVFLDEINEVVGTLNLSNQNRVKLQDAPYDMFCLPYDRGCSVLFNGSVIHTSEREIALQIAQAISKKYGATGLYDIQLVPYCPVIDFIDENGNINLGSDNNRLSYVKDANNHILYSIIWCHRSSDTIDIPLEEPIIVTEPKVQSECDMYRLVSPNFNGQFQFNVAKNGGLERFNVDFTYIPYTPYIHVNPDFGNLYGRDFNDSRGLICGGDFSLAQISSAWEKYQVENKNYQNIFDREVQNMEVKHSTQLANSLTNIGTKAAKGAFGGSLKGGIAGTLGGVGIGAISGITGVITNEIDYAEDKDYKKDMYGYQLGNIQAIPNSLCRTTAYTANNKVFPFLEYYTCTEEEKDALRNKIKYNGMTVMRIGTISQFIRSKETFIKGQIIRLSGISEDSHLAYAIYEEVSKGVYL